jgi:chaperonin GroES
LSGGGWVVDIKPVLGPRGGKVRPLDLKVGDKILFRKYGGTEVKVDGEELLVMREENVMAVIEK